MNFAYKLEQSNDNTNDNIVDIKNNSINKKKLH